MINTVRITCTLIVVITAVTVLSNGCKETKKQTEEVMVFAAASLTECFTEMADEFERKYNGKVVLNFAGSQTLATSIQQGARADVFASANTQYMEQLLQHKLIEESKIFASNRLVLCKNKTSQVVVDKLEDLTQEKVRLVAGDPTVPVGKYFYLVLDQAVQDNVIDEQVNAEILHNIKSKELNVKDIVSKVMIGEADVGVVYQTDVNKRNFEKLEVVQIPAFRKADVQYPIGVLKSSNNPMQARAFVDFVCSEKGRAILKKHHFVIE